jgi:hypothetical protein
MLLFYKMLNILCISVKKLRGEMSWDELVYCGEMSQPQSPGIIDTVMVEGETLLQGSRCT